ncbi:hypothetical protein RSOL_164640, partial [Rhizoctonia solani AG-3 Rhs1AP]
MFLSSDNPEELPIDCGMSDDLDEYDRGSSEYDPTTLKLEEDVERRRKWRRALPIIELNPGQTYEHHFNLSKYYDLSKLRPGSYQLHLNNHVRYEDDDGIHNYNIPELPMAISFTWAPGLDISYGA